MNSSNPIIIVGKGQGGQEELAEAINKLGYETFLTTGNVNPGSSWPRDSFVNYNGTYLTSHDEPDHPLGEGGNILTGNDFALVSSHGISIFEGYEPDLRNQQLVLNQLRRMYLPNIRLYVAPTGFESNGLEDAHIDFFMLLCPNNKLLLLDTNYTEATKSQYYDTLAEKEGLKLIRFDGSGDVMFPLNAAVIPGTIDTVLADSKATKLISILKDEGVNACGVPMPQLGSKTYGKVNCQTNIYTREPHVSLNHLLDF